MKLLLSLAVAGVLAVGVGACSDSSPSATDGAAGASNGNGGVSNGGGGAANGGGGATSGGAASTVGGSAAGGSAAGGSAAGGSAGATSGGMGGGSAGAHASGGSAGAGGASGSGAGGGTGYDPCPTNGDACKVMPLGDSITDGCCGENTKSMGASYRLELFRLSLSHGKKLTFVGSHQSGPTKVDNETFPKAQEGHSGWTIADGGGREGLQKNIAGWLKAAPPHVVTLMIGTNDVGIQLDLANAPKRLGTLLDTITQTAPNALVVLAQIVPSRQDDMNKRVQTYNQAMPALVKTFTDRGKHVILVDMYGAYTKHTDYKTALLANDLHPSDAGYAVMANTWWDSISTLLPNK